MHNSTAYYLLLDSAPQRTVLLRGVLLTNILFVQRNILDTVVVGVTPKVKDEIVPQMPKGSYYSLKKGGIFTQNSADVPEIVKQKAKRAMLLSKGYGHLVWFANMATHAYWSTASIDYDDTLLLQKRRPELVELFSSTKGISLAEAEKQISFDEDTLLTLALRRKQILWRYEETLLAVKTDEEYEAWKLSVSNDTFNVGTV